jgi:hypothetical protein
MNRARGLYCLAFSLFLVLAVQHLPVADARTPLLGFPGMAAAAQERRAYQQDVDADENANDFHALAAEAARSSRLQNAPRLARQKEEAWRHGVETSAVHGAGLPCVDDPLDGAENSSHVHQCSACGRRGMSYRSALRHARDATSFTCLRATHRPCAAKTAADAVVMIAMQHRVTVVHIEQLTAELAITQVALAAEAKGALEGLVQAATKAGGGTWATGVGYQQTVVARNHELSPGDRKTLVACVKVRARGGCERRFGSMAQSREARRSAGF